jgi:cation:H+ antiporter
MFWIMLFISAGIIVWAGIRLTRYADLLSIRLNWGHAWVGIVLLGLVTSLPEAITSLVAVARLHAGDLAMGNVMGSNIFNPMMIVIMDVAYRKGSVTNQVNANNSHKASALYAVGLTMLVVLGMIFGSATILGPMGWASMLVIVMYCVGMRHLAFLEAPQPEVCDTSTGICSDSLSKIVEIPALRPASASMAISPT